MKRLTIRARLTLLWGALFLAAGVKDIIRAGLAARGLISMRAAVPTLSRPKLKRRSTAGSPGSMSDGAVGSP